MKKLLAMLAPEPLADVVARQDAKLRHPAYQRHGACSVCRTRLATRGTECSVCFAFDLDLDKGHRPVDPDLRLRLGRGAL